ncbi:Ankyrin-3 [Fusarium culmorum]|uniref:Ankyrin-3 n=1 Tax=Fusarium culmorum TaxID=5516 RepID=A0A2T4GRX9_FUSCU|nr:Ankyrin-3 [Fusarium culmorum]
MLLDELDAPLDDVVVVDRLHIADYNEANILPQDETTLNQLFTWLNPTKYEGDGSELKKHATSHLQGTSQWLIDSPIFEQWHHGNSHRILWIRGVPGTGKSVLAAKLIAHLASEEVPVLYFFFRYTIQSNHRPEAALRDWIAQILPFSPPLQLALKNLTSGDINVGSVEDLTMSELWHLLRLALRSIGKAYCVVDALDEMDHEFMEHFLQVLDQLGNIHPDRVKLIITSRPITTIEKIVRNLRLLDIRLGKDKVDPDILKYLHHRLDQMSLTLEIRDTIVHEVLKKSDGLFLYAKFAMDTISRLENATAETVATALDSTPVDLSVMYRNLLQKHMGRTDLPEGLCILVLQLVTHATRPLRLLEIADCIKVARPQFGQDIGILKSLIRTSCGPLLEILPDESVRVVHHSLTEYLFGMTRSSPDKDIPLFEPGPMHNLLALICLSYLRAGYLDTLKYRNAFLDYMGLNGREHEVPPFFIYATNNWHVHTKRSSHQGLPQDEVNSSILSLLMTPENPRKLDALGYQFNGSGMKYYEELPRGQNITLEAEAILYAIRLDLTSFVEYFFSHNNGDAATYPGDRDIEPPLHQAIRNGNLDIVRLLIKNGSKTSHHSCHGDTPLHLALEVKHLLEIGADPWKDRGANQHSSYPPMKQALTKGDETMVKLFLPYIDSKEMAQKALDWVINGSQKAEIIHLILNLGLVDINSRTDGAKPLFRACTNFDPKAISILLEAGADPNVRFDNGYIRNYVDNDANEGRNVMHALATPSKHLYQANGGLPDKRIEECFQLVLAAGADVNQVDRREATPLHLAKKPLISKILLDAGADPVAENEDGLMPLHVARNLDLLEVLLTKTDINIRNRHGKTVLLHTFSGRDGKPVSEKAIRLLDLGADPNIIDNNGDSILHYLAGRGGISTPDRRRLLERLIQNGVDANLRNNKGQTAIHKMKLRSPDSIVADLQILLELTNIDINAVDDDGNTFLSLVVENESVSGDDKEVMERLMATLAKAGARFDVMGKRGRPLLHTKIGQRGDGKILKLLVDHGVDPEQTDNEGNTIWHAAVPKLVSPMSTTELLSNIVSLGIDIRKPNNQGKLPLHVLCEQNEGRMATGFKDGTVLFDYMMEQGQQDMNKADNDGVLPTHLASASSTLFTRMMLDAGADATLATHEGLNVFHIAARCRQSNRIGLICDWFRATMSMEKLFEAVNAKDRLGRNPLYYACASGHYQSVELLINAGAVIDFKTYEGSALEGCVEFERNLKDWVARGNCTYDAVYLDDTTRPKKDRGWRSPPKRGTYHEYRIDEILDLLVTNTTSASWREIDRAIVLAANQQHDYTVESLLRVRESLGMEEPLMCAAEVQLPLARRASVLASVVTVSAERRGSSAGEVFSDRIRFMIDHRLHRAIPSYVKDYSPKPGIKELYGVSLDLVLSGFADPLDALLTPDLVSTLENYGNSTEDGARTGKVRDMVSLLVAACQSEQPNLPVIQVLAKKGARLDKCSTPEGSSLHHQTTPLHAIVKTVNHWWKTAQALPYILEQAIDLEVRDGEGRTPLNATLGEKDQRLWSCQATEMLLRAGADPSSINKAGKSCLAHAMGNESLFKLLLRHGAEIGPAALAAAILAKDVHMLEMMLASGSDPNVRKVGKEIQSSVSPNGFLEPGAEDPSDESELYPLDVLITTMGYKDPDAVCEDMMKLLFDHGADPNGRYSKTTMVHRILQTKDARYFSVRSRRNCYVDTIVQHPLLDVNLKDAGGMTILQTAYEAGDLKSAQLLIERGCNVHGQDKDGRNVLHLRRRWGFHEPQAQMDFIERLVDLSPELLHQVDGHGQIPLHCAVQSMASEKEIELLVSKGADVCAKDDNGDTPLHFLFKQKWTLTENDGNMVLEERKKKLVGLFMSKGADINARNEAGETPVFSCYREGGLEALVPHDQDMRKTLEDPNAYLVWHNKLQLKTAVEQAPILWALLDEFGVDWTAVNNEGQSLLHVVAAEPKRLSNKRQLRFQFLMGKGLNALEENSIHQTALDVAAAHGAEDILALFNVE